jgi:hypothetical protein
VKAYIEGVRYKNDDEIIPCANRVQAEHVVKQICARHPEVAEDDLEITEIVFPSIKHLLMLIAGILITKATGG